MGYRSSGGAGREKEARGGRGRREERGGPLTAQDRTELPLLQWRAAKDNRPKRTIPDHRHVRLLRRRRDSDRLPPDSLCTSGSPPVHQAAHWRRKGGGEREGGERGGREGG